jgi:hypothetical protein
MLLTELLGSGKVETLDESPLGKALSRIADAAMDFIKTEGLDISKEGAELADSGMDLADMVLDLLEELGIIDKYQEKEDE